MELQQNLEAKPPGAKRRRITYPTSDGKPMAESDLHRELMTYAIYGLINRYASNPNVYVSGNNFLYWEEGEPKKRVSPDTYVVFGVPMYPRDCYKAWEEGGHLPDVVFEFTSRKTRHEDTNTKRPLYENVLKVPEYFVFDPRGDYLKPRLQGYRLVDGRYVPMELVDGRLYSEKLGLELVSAGESFRLRDPVTDEWLPTYAERCERSRRLEEARQIRRAEEATRRADEATMCANAEAALRQALENESRRLREEIAVLRRQSEQG